MKRARFLRPALLGGIVLLPACPGWHAAPIGRVPPEVVLADYGELVRRVEARAWACESLSGLADLQLQWNGQSSAAEAAVMVLAPQSFYFDLTGPLGLGLGSLSVTPERVEAVNLQDGWRWEGPPDAPLTQLGLPVDSARQLADFLLGRDRLPREAEAVRWEYDADAVAYAVRERREPRRIWTVDPTRFVVLAVRMEHEGRTILVEYGGHADTAEGASVPYRLDVFADGHRLQLEYSALQRGAALAPGDFRLPAADGLRTLPALPPLAFP